MFKQILTSKDAASELTKANGYIFESYEIQEEGDIAQETAKQFISDMLNDMMKTGEIKKAMKKYIDAEIIDAHEDILVAIVEDVIEKIDVAFTTPAFE